MVVDDVALIFTPFRCAFHPCLPRGLHTTKDSSTSTMRNLETCKKLPVSLLQCDAMQLINCIQLWMDCHPVWTNCPLDRSTLCVADKRICTLTLDHVTCMSSPYNFQLRSGCQSSKKRKKLIQDWVTIISGRH